MKIKTTDTIAYIIFACIMIAWAFMLRAIANDPTNANLSSQSPANAIYACGSTDTLISSKIEWSSCITIGPVTIITTNGTVKIKDGVTLDEASRKFWERLSKIYPECFPEYKKGLRKRE